MRGPQVRLTAAELSAWVEPLYQRLHEKLTWAKVAHDSGFKTVTVSMQRTRNQVDAQMLINICHTRGLDTVQELARVPRWRHLAQRKSSPSQLEFIASLHPAHALQEIADRLVIRAPNYPDFGPWDTYPGRFSTWIDVAGPPNARETLRTALELTASSMSGRLNDREKFRVDEVIDGFTAVEMDPVYALVLAGAITPQEAGYDPNIRQDALLSVSDEDLLEVNQRQQRYMRRILKDQRIAGEHLRKLQ